ncbi:ribosomal protein S18 acetylase RimI-like enzyme [Thermocatellispora tengchongensis]|uniref:Ribosomal protein S18 acetylase RimI-like enzyme n=1 Tax=Thermocatellispora tengchongensis TaxID=1073253 RepID=A0A840NWQ5_9ACTN|nr:GNAT family N-acetyltransferase [Thermocatellispora tengchongensis]MBB5131642.1 ribosomal protein S18 acetylase RimI-like enzyme [Thermocatellispora tengchongensis]
MIALRRVGPDEFGAALDRAIEIYTAAMRPPADQLAGRKGIMRTHATYPDFTCVFAERPDGVLVGFAYGFHGLPGQWWHDVIHRSISERGGEGAARGWLGNALEIAEVHVHPDYQGKGTGRAMMHKLCEGRPERTAVLSTHDQPTAARHLYHSLGFVDLLTQFVFPGGYERYAIVGAPLPLVRREQDQGRTPPV